MNVFIAEDQAWFLEQLIELVESIPGAQVIGTADTSQNAIDAIRLAKPDVALVDLMLREGTGFEILRRLRADAVNCKLFVVTSFPTAGIRKACKIGGADEFFDKLLELDELRQTLQTLSTTLG